MRARSLLSTAAVLATVACASSAPRPTTTVAPAVVSGDAPGLTLWPAGAGTMGAPGSALSYFSVDREGYAAAFAVTRDGRLRVVWPESPSGTGFVKPGRTYEAEAWMAQYGSAMFGNSTRVPYTFVIVSDQRLDLSRFGTGARWKHQMSVQAMTDEQAIIETIAETVLPSPEAAYAADYTYVAPRVIGQAAMLTQRCMLRNTDARDYAYFRDLWAVVDPTDWSLGPSAFATSWAYALGGWFPYSGRGPGLGLLVDRASRATSAFSAGCAQQYGYPLSYAYGGQYNPNGGLIVGQPGTPPVPGEPPRVDSTGNGTRPGDKMRVRPSEIYGAPTTVAAGGDGDVTAAADARRAELRGRLEAMREERRRGNESGGRGTWTLEPLASVDRARRESALRAIERSELGLDAGDAFGGRRGGMGRGVGGDEGARYGRRQDGGSSGGRPVAGRGSGESSGGAVDRGTSSRGTGSDDAGRGSSSRGESRGESRGGGESRSGGGEPRGSGTPRTGGGQPPTDQ